MEAAEVMDIEVADLYVRTSDEKQRENVSVDAQITMGMAYIEKNGWALGEVVIEVKTAKDVEHRPQFMRMIDKAQVGDIQHIVCYRVDRFMRNTIQGLETLDILAKNGVKLHDMSGGLISMETADDEFLATLKFALAARERRVTSERVKDCLRQKRDRGEHVGRFAPLGFKIQQGPVQIRKGRRVHIPILVPDEMEQLAITIAKKLGEQGFSLREIADELWKQGFTSRTGKKYTATTIAAMQAM